MADQQRRELTEARDKVLEKIAELQMPMNAYVFPERETQTAPLIAKLQETLEGLNECLAQLDGAAER